MGAQRRSRDQPRHEALPRARKEGPALVNNEGEPLSSFRVETITAVYPAAVSDFRSTLVKSLFTDTRHELASEGVRVVGALEADHGRSGLRPGKQNVSFPPRPDIRLVQTVSHDCRGHEARLDEEPRA